MADTQIKCGEPVDWNGMPPWCGEPAIGTFMSACVHEHVTGPNPVCAACAAEIQRGDWYCEPCKESAEPHACRVGHRFEWFADAAAAS